MRRQAELLESITGSVLARAGLCTGTSNGRKFRNNELMTVKTSCDETVTFADGRSLRADGTMMYIDQGIAVTSHASQGKTVDNVIVSAPVESFRTG